MEKGGIQAEWKGKRLNETQQKRFSSAWHLYMAKIVLLSVSSKDFMLLEAGGLICW